MLSCRVNAGAEKMAASYCSTMGFRNSQTSRFGFERSIWQRQIQRPRARPRLRVYHEEASQAAPPVAVVEAPAATSHDVDEQLEAKLDAVLEKVARFGQESLTDVERQLLLRASELYRKRRT